MRPIQAFRIIDMARRGRSRRTSGVEVTAVAVLLLIGAIVSAVQTLWPLLVLVAVGGLVAYIAHHFMQSVPAQTETGLNVELEPTITTRRTGPGSVVLELSLGPARRSAAEPAVDPDSVWVRPGQSVSVGGYAIPNSSLGGHRGTRRDPTAPTPAHLKTGSPQKGLGGSNPSPSASFSVAPRQPRELNARAASTSRNAHLL